MSQNATSNEEGILAEGAVVPMEAIASSIIVLREQKVILDADLARLYGVTTQRLNEQVRRNSDRFPGDFAFQLTREEFQSLMLHSATSKTRGGARKLPLAFTEHGAVMAASVLSTPRAVEVSVYVVRAFVRLRAVFAAHGELTHRLDELEVRIDSHDEEIALLVEAIRQLALPPEASDRRIGFRDDK